MKKQFQSLTEKGRWLLATLTLIFTLGIGQMWAADTYYVICQKGGVTTTGNLTSQSNSNQGLSVIKYNGGTYAVSEDITFADFPSNKSGKYQQQNIANILTSSNWATGSGTSYATGPKFTKGTSATIKLGSLTATKITFLGYPGGKAWGITIAGNTKSETNSKNWFTHEVTGSFTGDVTVSISNVNDIYGIFVIEASAAKYKVTFNNNGHGGDAPAAQSGITSGGKATEPTEPEDASYNFGGWYNKADWQADGAEKWNFGTSTVTKDTTLYAKWTDKSVPSTDATLSALSVAGCTFNETFDPATLAYTVDLPFYASMPATTDVTATKNDANALDPVVSISGNVISVEVTPESGAAGKKTYTITVNIADAPAASSSINIEQLILDNSTKYNIGAALDAAHISYANKDALDSLKDQSGRNEPYLGLKFKKNTSSVTIIVPDGQYLKVKFGYVDSNAGLKVSVNGATAVAPSLTDGIYTLPASVGIKQVVFTQPGTDKKTVVYKQIKINEEISAVILPWKVTYDAGEHGTCATTSQIWKGTALTLPTVTPASGWDFEGWYDGETKVTSPYNPGKDAALVAHYTAQAAGTDLQTLTYQIGAGAATNVGYTAGYYTYNIELPYKPSYDAITVNVTPVTGASVKDDATKVLTVSSLPGTATFTVTDGVNEQLYTVNFKKAAKTGVEIIGVVTTGGNNKTVSGLYKGDATVNLDSDKKIGSGKYIYVTLASGYTFEETDVLVVDVAAKSDLSGGNKALEITTGVGNIDGAMWKSIAFEDYTTGENTISLTGIAAGQTSIGLKRSANQNAYIDGLKVYRPMNPILTAITINGVACDKGESNTFSITLPEEGTDLAALTVVPTIIRNAAHATTPQVVVSNEGAWVEGANTYRVMDKDGDYTDYTITITLQGQAPAPVIATQPAGVAYCAGSEPTLEVEATGNELHYAWFKEAGETDEAVGTDAASYTIASASTGTYYVVVTNHVDGKLDASVTSANAVVTLNTAAAITKQPVNKRDIVSGASVTLSVEATNATGYQWYICDDAEKHNASAISGAEAANYVFNCSANAYYYCVVGNACGADIESDVVSVKLEPEGCNTFASKPAAEPYNYEQTGEWTFYYVDSNGADKSTDNVFEDGKNFDDEDVVVANTRRFALKFDKDVESVTLYGVGGNDKSFTKVSVSDEMKKNTYTELTATATKVDVADKQHVFTIEDVIIPAGKYAWFELSGSLKFFKICYTTALAMPKLPTLGNQELCAGAAYETFNATITNAAACEGTVSYKWYCTNDTENPVAETAEFTPTAEGTYYVVVTHAKAGHITRTAQSANLSVAHFDALTLVSNSGDVFQHMGTAATLSVVATGKNVAYVWYTCSNAAGDDAVAITPAETEAELTIASILEGVHYYKVVISHDCDATTLSHVFKVEGWDQLEQVDVTESTVWDMNNVSASEINLASMTPSKQNVLLLLANIEGVNNNASFNSQALMFEGQRIGRTENNVKYVSGQYVQFNVTVPGMVSVTFASNGSAQRTILINGKQCSRTTNDGTYIKYDVAVEPGSVEIEDVQGYVRISKIEFKAEDNYHRTVNPSFLGTLCWTNNAVLGGATLYEFAGKDEYNKLVFDEVAENRLEAGKPYIFMPENGNTQIKVYNTDDEAALTEDQEPVNHMYGTVEGKTLVPGQDDNMYYFSSNHIWAVKDFSVNIDVPAYYCYVDYPAVLAGEPAAAPAPGRRRVTMGVQGEQVVTGVENLNASEQPVKLLINGQIFILRGEKMFDATGRLVK